MASATWLLIRRAASSDRAGDRLALQPDGDLAVRRELDRLIVGQHLARLAQAEPVGVGVQVFETETRLHGRWPRSARRQAVPTD